MERDVRIIFVRPEQPGCLTSADLSVVGAWERRSRGSTGADIPSGSGKVRPGVLLGRRWGVPNEPESLPGSLPKETAASPTVQAPAEYEAEFVKLAGTGPLPRGSSAVWVVPSLKLPPQKKEARWRRALCQPRAPGCSGLQNFESFASHARRGILRGQ